MTLWFFASCMRFEAVLSNPQLQGRILLIYLQFSSVHPYDSQYCCAAGRMLWDMLDLARFIRNATYIFSPCILTECVRDWTAMHSRGLESVVPEHTCLNSCTCKGFKNDHECS